MKDEEVKPQLMKLLNIADEKVADKILQYTRLINDGTSTSLVNASNKKKAQQLLNALRANDFALAKALNERTTAIIKTIANAYQYNSFLATDMDIKQLNKSYVLLVNELEKIYGRNKELASISVTPAWKHFDIIEGTEWEISEHINQNHNDAGQSHVAQVNRLCIITGADKPNFLPALVKQIIDEADEAILAYKTILDEEKKLNVTHKRTWFIPEYKVTYSLDGTILVNNVLRLKKVHAGSVPDKLMEQATQNHDKVFKPNLGQTTRNISTTLSSMGFSGTLRLLFFPSVSKDKGILYRPVISRKTVDAEHIDTTELDTNLKKLGAITKIKPTEIPF